jgi:hypothetical protein
MPEHHSVEEPEVKPPVIALTSGVLAVAVTIIGALVTVIWFGSARLTVLEASNETLRA